MVGSRIANGAGLQPTDDATADRLGFFDAHTAHALLTTFQARRTRSSVAPRLRTHTQCVQLFMIIASSIAVAACGGQAVGDAGTPAPTPDPAVACTSTIAPSAGYGLGVCASTAKVSTVFVSTTTTVSVTSVDAAAPQFTLRLDAASAAGESSSIAFASADVVSNKRVGAVNGMRLSKPVGAAATDFAEITDFHVATPASGSVSSIAHGSFGTWSRYSSTTQGFEGVWFSALGPQGGVTVPTSGSITFAGVAVGSIGPADATTGAKIQTLSGQITLTVNYQTGAVTGTLTNLMSSAGASVAAAASIVALPITGTLNLAAPLNFSGALVAPAVSPSAGTGDGVLEGLGVGADTARVTEVIGRIRFNTTDNRRVLLAFGAK